MLLGGAMPTRDEIDMRLRAYVMTLCAPIWWEQGKQTVVNSGTMCVVQTDKQLFGITNAHVLKIYEKHKAEKSDIFCQLGSAPFDPTANRLSYSEHWDLATFTIPRVTLRNFNHKVLVQRQWPPAAISVVETVVYGGYPEERRSVPPGANPQTVTSEFVSFLGRPHNCTTEDISFQIEHNKMTWLPNVENPLEADANLSGISGGPCFRLIPAEERIELAGFIYEGRWDVGLIFARQADLISATGEIAAVPPGVRSRELRPSDDEPG